jgi:hypothetical protein
MEVFMAGSLGRTASRASTHIPTPLPSRSTTPSGRNPASLPDSSGNGTNVQHKIPRKPLPDEAPKTQSVQEHLAEQKGPPPPSSNTPPVQYSARADYNQAAAYIRPSDLNPPLSASVAKQPEIISSNPHRAYSALIQRADTPGNFALGNSINREEMTVSPLPDDMIKLTPEEKALLTSGKLYHNVSGFGNGRFHGDSPWLGKTRRPASPKLPSPPPHVINPPIKSSSVIKYLDNFDMSASTPTNPPKSYTSKFREEFEPKKSTPTPSTAPTPPTVSTQESMQQLLADAFPSGYRPISPPLSPANDFSSSVVKQSFIDKAISKFTNFFGDGGFWKNLMPSFGKKSKAEPESPIPASPSDQLTGWRVPTTRSSTSEPLIVPDDMNPVYMSNTKPLELAHPQPRQEPTARVQNRFEAGKEYATPPVSQFIRHSYPDELFFSQSTPPSTPSSTPASSIFDQSRPSTPASSISFGHVADYTPRYAPIAK